jgi:thiol-disulfide isomerase/thioredoxin
MAAVAHCQPMPFSAPAPAELTDPQAPLVACLCAAWCQTCDSYHEIFRALAPRFPQWRFVWVDIEDHADALEGQAGEAPDITDFPTLLLSQGGQVPFFGVLLPHAGVLERLLQQAEQASLRPHSDASSLALAIQVRALADSGALHG